jgi:hypothetical protein
LKLGAVAFCGCAVGRKAFDLSGMRFGRLTVLARAGWGGGKSHRLPAWLCRCDCGCERVVTSSSLTQSQMESCGCLQNPRNRTHGLTGSPEHGVWVGMQSSCLNLAQNGFKSRGARGIEVCEQWLGSLDVFIGDVGMRPTPKHWLRRKDTRGNFEPSNVHWRLPGKAGESLPRRPGPVRPDQDHRRRHQDLKPAGTARRLPERADAWPFVALTC